MNDKNKPEFLSRVRVRRADHSGSFVFSVQPQANSYLFGGVFNEFSQGRSSSARKPVPERALVRSMLFDRCSLQHLTAVKGEVLLKYTTE